MPALWLRFLSVLCLACTALSNPVEGGVVWKDIGGSITIHCRAAALPPQNLLSLKRGLHKDEIFTTNNDRRHNLVSKNVEGRLLVVGVFPDLDLIIGNLTMEETGLYRCFYSKTGRTIETKEGEGAVLLVVKEGEQCEAENTHLLQGTLVGCAALLLIIIIGFFLWIILKTRTRKAKRTITNDVYEDMRGTLRR